MNEYRWLLYLDMASIRNFYYTYVEQVSLKMTASLSCAQRAYYLDWRNAYRSMVACVQYFISKCSFKNSRRKLHVVQSTNYTNPHGCRNFYDSMTILVPQSSVLDHIMWRAQPNIFHTSAEKKDGSLSLSRVENLTSRFLLTLRGLLGSDVDWGSPTQKEASPTYFNEMSP
eukprot:scaffold844_cov268-Chaetoceros_neogracile.AAC.14